MKQMSNRWNVPGYGSIGNRIKYKTWLDERKLTAIIRKCLSLLRWCRRHSRNETKNTRLSPQDNNVAMFNQPDHITRIKSLNAYERECIFPLNVLSLFRAIYAFMPKILITNRREEFHILCKQNIDFMLHELLFTAVFIVIYILTSAREIRRQIKHQASHTFPKARHFAATYIKHCDYDIHKARILFSVLLHTYSRSFHNIHVW